MKVSINSMELDVGELRKKRHPYCWEGSTADHELFRLALTGTRGAEAQGIEAFFVRSEIHYYVQEVLSPAQICNRDLEDWLPTGFPSACRPAATHGCGAAGALRMEYLYTCESTLIVPGHPYQTDLHQKGVAFLHSLIPWQDTSQHNTQHIYTNSSRLCMPIGILHPPLQHNLDHLN